MSRTVIAALALICAIASARTQDFSAEDLARRTIERRAVEAVNWGMPAVKFDLMLQAMIGSAKGKPNQIVYWSRLPDWKNQTLTPNPEVIYLMPFFHTKDAGPMVLEIPPRMRAPSPGRSWMRGRRRWKMSLLSGSHAVANAAGPSR
jgi:hypothetical protein